MGWGQVNDYSTSIQVITMKLLANVSRMIDMYSHGKMPGMHF